MESSVPMILPKGIVINTSNIYKEVARYPVIPADKIWEYWHVYTTTNKKLKDPTARRLENFWWQVWGSDRRYLSGRALARIYEDISIGPTFVPLHGPPNRWEGPDVTPLSKQQIVAHLIREAGAAQDRPEAPRMRSNDASIRSLSSSASKPPPPHPILKKSRSPLATGPRPTARFVSPPESGDELAKESDVDSSASTAPTGLEMPVKHGKPPPITQKLIAASTSLSWKDKTWATNKQQVTNSNTHSLPPVVAGENAPEKPLSKDRQRIQKQTRTTTSISGQAATHVSSVSGKKYDEGSRSAVQPRLSAKAAGKQPAVSRVAITDSSRAFRSQSRPAESTSLANANSLVRNTSELRSPVSTRSLSLTRTEADNSSTTGSVTDSSSTMGRPITQNNYGRKSSTQGLFTGATATTTNIAAQGHIIDQAGSLPASTILGSSMDGTSLASHSSAASLVDSRMVPTQPSPAASVPMGRTRSQLTLLLERGKSRIGDKSPFRK